MCTLLVFAKEETERNDACMPHFNELFITKALRLRIARSVFSQNIFMIYLNTQYVQVIEVAAFETLGKS